MTAATLDALDADDYDPITHLNVIFSHPSTLASVSHTQTLLTTYQDDLDDEIDLLEEEQARSHADCLARMQSSKSELAELFTRIESVRERALQTEKNITAMTADIKALDNTKKNLTLSMTALKRLQMLTTAYEQLRSLVKTRQYRECAQLLQAVMQLMQHFKSYRSIDQIASLSRNVADLQREVLEQVCEDFELTFSKHEVPQKRGMLHEACLVVDALGDAARSRLVTWYTNTELRQYRQIFKGEQEAGSLDNIDRRYKWFKKTLKGYDEEHAAIFPAHWHVGEHLANVFAEGTREDYKGILGRSTRAGQTLDVRLLLSCLQQTLEFEQGLERRFSGGSRASIDTTVSEREAQVFGQPISTAFEPYLSLWVDAQDKDLAALVPQYRSRPPKPPDEEFSSQTVISSASELFNFYRLSLAQCAKLSTGQALLDLSRVFGKYLDMYAQQVLLAYLTEKPSTGTPSRRPSLEDTILVLNTADYCYSTTTSLSEKIASRIDEALRPSVDLTPQADAFMGLASASIRSLITHLSSALSPHFSTMRSTPYSRIETASDTSPFMPALTHTLTTTAHQILDYLQPLKPHYTRAFTDALPSSIADIYLSSLPSCRPISEGGAEQMLLDLHALRTTLSPLLSDPPPPSYAKRLSTAFSRIEPLLKTLQVRPSPPEALVQAYLVHIADLSEANFRKVLELKGIGGGGGTVGARRSHQETVQLVELFNMHKLSPRYKDALVERSALLTPLNLNASATASFGGGGGIGGGSTGAAANVGNAALGNLTALGSSAAQSLSGAHLPGSVNMKMNMNFDASGLASGLMDRFGGGGGGGGGGSGGGLSPGLGGTPGAASPSAHGYGGGGTNGNAGAGAGGGGVGGVNPMEAAGLGVGVNINHMAQGQVPGAAAQGQGGEGKLNENLKNIGKFFKRDLGALGLPGGLGGLGGRFGSVSPAPPAAGEEGRR
ncbi:uncharacterized protein HMPREF1541_07860 [Cyphellophora europaea CBS 101466]|uniref:Uncharacterized protein n=1 Tax=Cyphellophora europaea (strain CBS 101466) TaxID=1220924 RepID=W2RMF8_CYPE1|nr:uncharacterized protein HMPREF1541_07860 [Cyphellophora europaea CBS 101466]ETN36873.1 hypothetical protein HMPREF1541_07860 [Cyphellophora europaea CBS 101466]